MEMTNFNNSELVELNIDDQKNIDGGFWEIVVAVGLAIVGGCYALGSACAEYDRNHNK